MTHQDCPCSGAFALDQEHHDWLLSFEERGVVGVVEILCWLDNDADRDDADEIEDGRLMWVDFPDFVAMHNWQEPFAVRTLAGFITTALARRRGVLAHSA